MPAGERIGFRMQLLTDLLRRSGISDCSIFLHEPSSALFGVLRRAPGHAMDRLPEQEIMRTGPDGASVSEPLPLVFHMD